MQSLKKRWKGLLKLIGPLLFILFILRVVDPRSVIALLGRIRIGLFLAAVLLFPVLMYVFTIRWWIICRRLGMGNSFWQSFQIYYISWFLSFIPLSGTVPVSKVLFLKEEGESVGSSLVSITLDKLFDIIGIILFGIYGIIYFPKNIIDGKFLWLIYWGVFIFLTIAIFFGRRIWERLRKLIKQYLKNDLWRIGKDFETDFTNFWSGFGFTFFCLLLGLSIFLGISRSIFLYILAISLGMDVTFALIVACSALIGVVNLIPINVSGLGTRDAVLLLTLPIMGISKEAAIALGFLAFLWTLCSKFSGIIFWLKHPLPSKAIQSFKEKVFNAYS